MKVRASEGKFGSESVFLADCGKAATACCANEKAATWAACSLDRDDSVVGIFGLLLPGGGSLVRIASAKLIVKVNDRRGYPQRTSGTDYYADLPTVEWSKALLDCICVVVY
jgi:hypothetical protein